jgi:hypothetical protein
MSKVLSKTWNGRKIKREITLEKGEVTKDVPFVALRKAEEYLRMNAFQWGSLDGDNPVGFMFGQYKVPQKWSNMSPEDKKKLDGVLISDDFRNGDVKVIIFL